MNTLINIEIQQKEHSSNMKYNARSYRNHDLIQRYCRYIDDNTVVIRDDREDSDGSDFECLTPQRCGGRVGCPHNRMHIGAEMRIPDSRTE